MKTVSRKKERGDAEMTVLIILAVVVILGGMAFAFVQAHNESRVYNKLTGADTTTWDALWVQLRVTEPLKE